MSRKIKISWKNQYVGYESSFIIQLFKLLAKEGIQITTPAKCDILIKGPHTPRPSWRQRGASALNRLLSNNPIYDRLAAKRKYQPTTIYQTWENTRYDAEIADYSISSDLAVDETNHLRLPLWLASLDWASEGILTATCPRYGKLLTASRLLEPLGNLFLRKPRRAAFITTHLIAPRTSLYKALSKSIPVDGFGAAFNNKISNHNLSNFTKVELLSDYGFSLCPENSLYPGYFTEKIPEAFAADTMPISWCDSNVKHDFNVNAFINLHDYADEGYEAVIDALLSPGNLQSYCDQPLLQKAPEIETAIQFIQKIISEVR